MAKTQDAPISNVINLFTKIKVDEIDEHLLRAALALQEKRLQESARRVEEVLSGQVTRRRRSRKHRE